MFYHVVTVLLEGHIFPAVRVRIKSHLTVCQAQSHQHRQLLNTLYLKSLHLPPVFTLITDVCLPDIALFCTEAKHFFHIEL